MPRHISGEVGRSLTDLLPIHVPVHLLTYLLTQNSRFVKCGKITVWSVLAKIDKWRAVAAQTAARCNEVTNHFLQLSKNTTVKELLKSVQFSSVQARDRPRGLRAFAEVLLEPSGRDVGYGLAHLGHLKQPRSPACPTNNEQL